MTDPSPALAMCLAPLPPVTSGRPGERLALLERYKWQPGQRLDVGFLDGEPALQDAVWAAAQGWLVYANLSFRRIPAGEYADIRITFQTQGAWSQLGTQARASAPAASMGFGVLTPDTDPDELRRQVLHEFGHALGLVHEHANPEGGIRWNREKVYAWYAALGWDKERVDRNVLRTHEPAELVATPIDAASIMMYPVPPELTEDGFSVGWNRDLSAVDKAAIRSAYP